MSFGEFYSQNVKLKRMAFYMLLKDGTIQHNVMMILETVGLDFTPGSTISQMCYFGHFP